MKKDKKQWAIVELLGHVKIAGVISEEERFGTKMGRVDIPIGPKKFVTQYFGGSSVYRITPTTEDLCRRLMEKSVPAPVGLYELPAPRQSENYDQDDMPF